MKKLLVLNFFPAFMPPASGGELRYFHLYNELSHYFDITLLSPTHPNHPYEIVTHSPQLREHRIPKEPIYDRLHYEISREAIAPEFSALVCALAARQPNAYHAAFLELQKNADAIVHEFPYMLEYDFLFGRDEKPRIYSSHNVESDLVSQIWQGEAAKKYIDYITDLEARLVTGCTQCFAVSEAEAERLMVKFGVSRHKIAIAPNGIIPGDIQRSACSILSEKRSQALFFGSFHPPNIEAADFIIHELAPQCLSMDFIIAGNCLDPSAIHAPPNVQVLGKVDDHHRRALFASADIALNPMFSGAGTNVKALEYLAAGIPMITTELGARGLGLSSGEHALLVERQHFVEMLQQLVNNTDLQRKLAREGMRYVTNQFSWKTIASHVRDKIDSSLSKPLEQTRRKILVLNDFSIANPVSGGELRINRLYTSLSAYYDIILVCLSWAKEISWRQISNYFIEIGIPRTNEHTRAEADLSCKSDISIGDIISYQYAPRNDLLVALIQVFYSHCHLLILSHPYMAGTLTQLAGKPIIYDSHNAEYILKQDILRNHPDYHSLLQTVYECESLAVRRSHIITTVADTDRAALVKLGADPERIFIVANGVDVPTTPTPRPALPAIKQVLAGRPLILFIGSRHLPNVEAFQFICAHLSPTMPRCLFGIIGSVCNAPVPHIPPNVLLFGAIDSITKDIIIELAELAINPMRSGSGSSLKLAEYFAHGLPTITTAFGARGYTIISGNEAIICELEQFADQLASLLADPARCRQLGAAAYAYALAQLDWSWLAAQYRRVLEQKIFTENKKRLLVVTYRFTEPPPGGAEVHLLELLRQLDRRSNFYIDVATLDIVSIENQYHFSAQYTLDMDYPYPRDLANLHVYRFRTDVLSDSKRLENARRLFTAWMGEFRQTSLQHLDSYDRPLLLGGWHYPWRAPAGIEAWSSERGLIFSAGAESMTIRGYAPAAKRLRIVMAEDKVEQHAIKGDFELNLHLGEHIQFIAIEVDPAYAIGSDPRTVGVCIREISYIWRGHAGSIPLDFDYRMYLKKHAPAQYIETLISTAKARTATLDRIFQETRGPNSRELEDWLSQNSDRYDIVLGHSVPFNTLIFAAQYARAASKPLIHLPHFHIDDEFYHWECYYKALGAADSIIASPQAAIDLFYNKIQAASFYLPPGVPGNQHPTYRDEQEFFSLYHSQLPYVLVLGRKDRSKNYEATLAAVTLLNQPSRLCNVVMIGRDEDGLALAQNKAIYLGSQPGGIVLAALKNAVCLVSMSDSESFGIVLLESWSQKRPVIASDACHASIELIADGVDGLLASPVNLTEKIRYYLEHPDTAKIMGQAGYAKVQQSFTWEAIGGKLNAVLVDLLESYTERLTLKT